jgi:uncharacterized membrane protein HdeD (DUF308 family)
VLHTLSRNWWVLVLRGVLGILFGLIAYASPGVTLGALILLFGAYALIDGVFAIVSAVKGKTDGLPWWALLVEGVLGLVAGLVTFAMPGITLLVLLYLVAGWAIVSGVFEIIAAIRLRKEIEGEWALVVGGVISILLGVILLAAPGVGLLAAAYTIGTYAIIFGVLLLLLGLRLRKVAARPT